MEPQLIDYYNETPHGINVIDKMNEEFAELQKKYLDLEKKINKFKTPFIHAETKEEYKEYADIICNQFKNKIKGFLYDEETGLLAVMNEFKTTPSYWLEMYSARGPYGNGKISVDKMFQASWYEFFYLKKESCLEKIINELDLITKHKNKEWCELRINIAFETCLKSKSVQLGHGAYPGDGHRFDDSERIHDLIHEEIIEDLIHHIFNDEHNDYLPRLYIETCRAHSLLEFLGGMDDGGMNDLICFNCKKCGKLDNYNDELLCVDCE